MNPSDNTAHPMQPSQSYHFGRNRLPRPDDANEVKPFTPAEPQTNNRVMQPGVDSSLAEALEAARKRLEELHAEPAPAQHAPGSVVAPLASDITAPKPAETAQPEPPTQIHNAETVAPAPSAPIVPEIKAVADTLPFSDPLRTTSASHNPTFAKPQAKQTAAKEPSKKSLPSRLKPILTAVGAVALIFVIFKAQILLSQIGYLTGNKGATSVATQSTAVSAASVIAIPKINVNAPVVYQPSIVEASVQKSLESGVVHYGNTPVPGQVGNSVFVGHSSNDWWEPGNYKFVFVLLDKMVVGDTFSINYQSQKYVYQVTEVKVVEPTDMSVLNATTEPTVTLITCTPPGTSWKRLIVKAKQISPTGTTKSVTGTQSASATPSLPGSSTGFFDQVKGVWKGFVAIFSGGNSTTDTPATSTPSASSLPSAS